MVWTCGICNHREETRNRTDTMLVGDRDIERWSNGNLHPAGFDITRPVPDSGRSRR